ncbi:MAG TPA: thiamine phosphate synthase [Candidatus Merdivicinus faecavium]|nr:thiamine phosphate synthase [Candidatus Merdivicinus faecavium]
MKGEIDYSLYLCTDRGLMTSATIEESVEAAVRGGATVVQLREKDCSSREFYELGLRVREITARYGVPLFVNDRADIALAVGADGVHVGQSDLPCRAVRAIAPGMLVGVSASSLAEAVQAERDGADYLGVGAMFATGTKTDAAIVSMEELEAIRRAVSIPIVVIGGINKQTIPAFRGKGIDGAAVVSAIVAQPDPEAAARELLQLWKS